MTNIYENEIDDTIKWHSDDDTIVSIVNSRNSTSNKNKMLSYSTDIALQGALVLAKSGRLEVGDNILHTL